MDALGPSAFLLLGGVLLDAILGDPILPFHPVRLIGRTLSASEAFLRRCGWDGYGGGCALFLFLFFLWVAGPSLLVMRLYAWSPMAGATVHLLLLYMLLALRDLIDHVWTVQRAARRDDVGAAREATGRLTARDTATMEASDCRRAAIESLSENFVDGFLSPVFWYVLLGLPGLLLFKVVSTMDSMVGYRTPEYLRFGWCGARLDDLMNYIPARLAWIILGLSAAPIAGLSTTKGWRIGLQHHAVVPGPNSGWSEATMAGLLQRRLIGPIWKDGVLVTSVWVGEPSDPQAGKDRDLTLAIQVTLTAAVVILLVSTAALGILALPY